MRIPDQKLNEILEQLDIVGLVNNYVTLKNKGGRWWGLCPFHTEKTASFSVQPDKGLYYCFGCQKGGTVFNFIMDMENLSFVESVQFLAEKAGVQLEIERNQENREEDERRKTLFEMYRRIADSMHYMLMNNPKGKGAMDYLNGRGVTEKSIHDFNIGFVPPDGEWLYKFLRKNNYSTNFLAGTGLFSRKNISFSPFMGRIIFPIMTVHNTVIAFGGRKLGEGEPKYYNSPESDAFKKGRNLYGIHLALSDIKKQGTFILTEGYFDVVMLHQAGIKNCIAPLGTAFTEDQAFKMKRYVNQGILLFDGDNAGKRATEKSIHICEKAGIICSVVELPEGSDPADYIEKHGPEALQKLLKYPINSFDYLVRKAAGRYDTASLEGKELFLRSLIPYINIIQSDTKRESCIQVIAEKLEVDYHSISKDIVRWGQGKRKYGSSGEIKQSSEVSTELFLLLAITVFREYFEEVRNFLSVDDLTDRRARDVFIALEECYRLEESSSEALLEKIQDSELKKMIIIKGTTAEFNQNTEKIIRDSIRTIKKGSIEKKRRKIERRLREYESEGMDLKEVKELLNEKIYYDKELERLKGTEYE